MMDKKSRNQRTDRAWEKLYNRLEREGLVEDRPSRKVACFSSRLAWGTVAACLVLVVAGSWFWFSGMEKKAVPEQLVKIENLPGEPTLVTALEDGSFVYLGEDTSLSFPEAFSTHKREVHLSGEAFFEVTQVPGAPFVIGTRDAVVEVIGTSFTVKEKANGRLVLSVNSGEVKVTSRVSEKSVRVRAGETVWLENSGLRIQPTEEGSGTELLLERICFKDQLLTDVVKVINQRAGRFCMEVDPLLSHRRLNATFMGHNVEEMATIICRVMDLGSVEKDGVIRIVNHQ